MAIELAKIPPGRQPPWAQMPIRGQPRATVDAFQRGLTVNLIATHRASFETCRQDEILSNVVERNRQKAFDFLPVVEPAGDRIVGMVEIAPYMHAETPEANIGLLMHPLSEENLLGADASILTFVRDADRQKCRLIVSGHEISGLVSLSDLQWLPVRAALFGLVTNLEIIMINVIRYEFNGTEEWLDRLLKRRRLRLQDQLGKARVGDAFVDALLFTQFADKVNILSKSERWKIRKDQFDSEFERIHSLRNHLAHANDYCTAARF